MTFTEFVSRLYPILGEGSSTHAFAKSILSFITTEAAAEILDKHTKDTYKSYFNGKRTVSKLAKELTPYIEPENFVSYIDELPSDALRDSLCKNFSDVSPDATPFNIGEELSVVFASILRKEASKTRKSPQKKSSEEPHEETDDGRITVLDETDNKITVIHHQTNIVQNGTNNVNLTNNGTMTLNL